MRTRTAAAFGFTVTLALVVAALLWSTSPEPTSSALAEPAIRRGVDGTPAPPIVSDTVAAPSARQDRSSALYHDFRNTSDLSEIVDHAGADPGKGSYYYASLALRECSEFSIRLAGITPGEIDGDVRRVAAIRRIRARCAKVGDVSYARMREIESAGRAAGDTGLGVFSPEGGVSRNAAAKGDKNEYLISAFLAASDVGVMESLAQDLAVGANGLRLAGQEHTEELRASLPIAMFLVPCEFGAECGPSNRYVIEECAVRGNCSYSSLQELMRARGADYSEMYTAQPGRFDYALAEDLARRIAEGIRAGRKVLVKN